jgi:hypothetical protein
MRRPAALALALALTACGSASRSSAPAPTPVPTSPSRSSSPAVAATGPRTGADWTTYGGGPSRASAVPGPDPAGPRVAWTAALDGRVYASPLVVSGTVVIATESNTLYGLAGSTGRVRWRRHVGAPVPGDALPCGNIDPLGMTGTPVYDPATGTVFVVATEAGPQHVLYGVDPRTGAVRSRRPVDVPGMEPATDLQRAALLVSGGRVVIAYGGNYGDCGQYRGRVVSAPTTGSGPLVSFVVPTSREAGIWGASGPALLPGGDLLVSTGNGAATGGSWDRSDSVLRLSPDLALRDGFAPRQWAQENSADADLGSMGPLLLPGGTRVLTAGKGGNVFLLDAGRLGGVGGQLDSVGGCSAYGGGALVPGGAVLPCDGGLREVQVGGDRLAKGWRSDVVGSPLVVGSTVWVVDQEGRLTGLAAGSGKRVASLSVGSATRFAKPAFSGNLLLLPTKAGVTAVQLRP